MATRSEVDQRRTELRADLENLSQSRGLAPGVVISPVRELAERFGLSIKVVRGTLQQLIDEGVLYTVPRVGTFVGRRHTPDSGYYLLLLASTPTEHDQEYRVQIGFEERIAQLGGASLAMVIDEALYRRDTQQLPLLSGVFDFKGIYDHVWNGDDTATPSLVVFADLSPNQTRADAVSFDNVDGGYQAARYLLGLGHRRIGYLGLHAAPPDATSYIWSVEREEGWRQAMLEAGQSPESLFFPVEHTGGTNDANQRDAVRSSAMALTARTEITAVVTANDNAAMGLFAVLHETAVPERRWPVVVSFDNLIHAGRYMLTSFNLPWEGIGRAAADILWDRQHKRLVGRPVHRRVPMRLIRRLTSQAGWSVALPPVTPEVFEADAL